MPMDKPLTETSLVDLSEIDKRAAQLMRQSEMVGLSVAIVENLSLIHI